jgi:hypothetical protein
MIAQAIDHQKQDLRVLGDALGRKLMQLCVRVRAST